MYMLIASLIVASRYSHSFNTISLLVYQYVTYLVLYEAKWRRGDLLPVPQPLTPVIARQSVCSCIIIVLIPYWEHLLNKTNLMCSHEDAAPSVTAAMRQRVGGR